MGLLWSKKRDLDIVIYRLQSLRGARDDSDSKNEGGGAVPARLAPSPTEGEACEVEGMPPSMPKLAPDPMDGSCEFCKPLGREPKLPMLPMLPPGATLLLTGTMPDALVGRRSAQWQLQDVTFTDLTVTAYSRKSPLRIVRIRYPWARLIYAAYTAVDRDYFTGFFAVGFTSITRMH